MTVKVGDKVLYGKYAGTEITIRWKGLSYNEGIRYICNCLIFNKS